MRFALLAVRIASFSGFTWPIVLPYQLMRLLSVRTARISPSCSTISSRWRRMIPTFSICDGSGDAMPVRSRSHARRNSQGVRIAPRAIITPAQPVARIMWGTCSGSVMSPLPITGIDRTAATTWAMPSSRARPLNICSVVRPCTVMAAMPTSSSCRASRGATMRESSHPRRTLAVTGTRPPECCSTARTIRSASRVVESGSQSSSEPPFFLATLSTGQPMLISTMLAP